MIYLLLSILFLTIANISQRYSADAKANAFSVNAVTRIFSGIVALAAIVSTIGFEPMLQASTPVLSWAILGGTFYWLAGLAAIKAFGLGHVGISSTVLRCSMVIPTAASIILWRDVPLSLTSTAMWLVIGTVVLLIIGIFLSGLDQIFRERANKTRLHRPWLIWLLLAFVGQGVWEITLRAAGAFPTETDRQVYLALVFIIAMLISVGTVVVMRIHVRWVDCRFGLLLGILASLATLMRPYAVRDLSGVVVFPMTAMGTMLLMNIASVILWKTHLGKWGYAGLGAAVAATILLCFR